MTRQSLALHGVDGRSAPERRRRDLVKGFLVDLGIQKPTEREMALVRQAASLILASEQMQARIVNGEQVDVEEMSRLGNLINRTMRELGLKKRQAERPRSIREQLMGQK